MKIKLAIIEKDNRFLDRLTSIFTKNYSDKLEVYPFVDPDVALSTLSFMKVDVLIADESFHISDHSLPDGCCFAYFVSNVGVDTLRGHRAICKFQRAELIYKQIAGLYLDVSEHDPSRKLSDAEAKLLVFTSPAGGVGVSSAAAACAKSFASKGKRVLYLDLDPNGAPSLFFHAGGTKSFGDVLQTLVNKNGNLADLLEHSVRKDQSGVCFFSESMPDQVYPRLSVDDITKLLRELRIIASYDYIVLDVAFATYFEQMHLLERSHTLVMISDDTENSQSKLTRAYHRLTASADSDQEITIPNMFLLYNKSTGFSSKILTLADVPELGSIPRLQNANPDAIVARIASLDVFDAIC